MCKECRKCWVGLVLACLLTACGNKGPLVLPEAGNDKVEDVEQTQRELTN